MLLKVSNILQSLLNHFSHSESNSKSSSRKSVKGRREKEGVKQTVNLNMKKS